MAEPAMQAQALRVLALRLASTLDEAHRAGRLHLALSPRHVSLPDGAIAGYGAAFDAAFAAPEQLWHSSVGPWTDVYSLGLVLLALASRRAVPESATIVGAIAARRQQRDLDVLPAEMRAAVARMIEADPARRPQTMSEVSALLEGRAFRASAKPGRLWWVAAAGAAMLCVAVAAAWSVSFRTEAPAVHAFRPAIPAEERLRRKIEASLQDVACSWLDIGYPQAAGRRIRVDASGAAASTPDEIARKLQAAAGARAAVDASAVITVDRASCAMLDALRSFREPSSERGRALDVKQARFHLQTGLQSCRTPALRQAQVVVDARVGGGDFGLFLVDAKGGLKPLYADRAAFERARATDANAVGDRGAGVWRLTFCTAASGPAAVLLVKGRGPFDAGADAASFADRAWAKGWTTQMAWYRVLSD